MNTLKCTPTTAAKQEGVTLLVALIMLLVMTLIGLSGMQETVMEDRMALSFRDRAMADISAESGLRAAEQWLAAETQLPLAETSATCSTPPRCGATDGYVVWDTGQVYNGHIQDMLWSDFQTMAVPYEGSGTTSSSISKIHAQPRAVIEFRSFNPVDSNGYAQQQDAERASLGVGPYYYNVMGGALGYRADTLSVVETTYVRWF